MSDDNKNIDDIIKGGFDETNDDFNLDSWDDLANRMDQNDDLDSSIASAFNTTEEEVPSSVWSNVNDDLDIDTVWSRIDTALTKRKRRAIIWWNAASIAFVILIIGGLITKQPDDLLYTTESLNIEQHDVVVDKSMTDANYEEINTASDKKNANDLTTSELNISLANIEESELQMATKDLYKIENTLEEKNYSETGLYINPTTKERIDNELTFNTSTLEPLILEFNDPILKSLAIKDVNTIDSTNSENNPSNIGVAENPSRKWLIGLKGSVVNCEIIDGLSSEANSENSLVSSNFTVTFNPALFAQYKLKNGYFLQTDFYWNYKVRRSVNKYDQLEYVSKTTELDYLRINFNAGKSFQLSKLTDKLNLNVTLGGYWDYLKSQREYRGRTLISEQKSYDSNNYGLSSEIAIQHNFKRISIAYGTELDLGLHNINLTSASAFSGFNAARTLSYGLFFRLGYSF